MGFFDVNMRQICLYADMLNRLLRYLVTSTVLLAMAFAGFPVILCVSEAHGAMIEVGWMHLDHSRPSANHRALFGELEKSAQSQPCSDFQPERGTVAKGSRDLHVALDNRDASIFSRAARPTPSRISHAPEELRPRRRNGSFLTWNCLFPDRGTFPGHRVFRKSIELNALYAPALAEHGYAFLRLGQLLRTRPSA